MPRFHTHHSAQPQLCLLVGRDRAGIRGQGRDWGPPAPLLEGQ